MKNAIDMSTNWTHIWAQIRHWDKYDHKSDQYNLKNKHRMETQNGNNTKWIQECIPAFEVCVCVRVCVCGWVSMGGCVSVSMYVCVQGGVCAVADEAQTKRGWDATLLSWQWVMSHTCISAYLQHLHTSRRLHTHIQTHNHTHASIQNSETP